MFFNRKKEVEKNKLLDNYNLIRNEIAIRDISDKCLIKLEGKDALAFLHRISTNHVKELKEHEIKKTLFLNDKGRIIDRTILLVMDGAYWLSGSKGNGFRLRSWLEKYIITEDITTEDITESFFKIELIGKSSGSYLTQIFGGEIDSVNSSRFVKLYVDEEGLVIFKNYEKDHIDRFIIVGNRNLKEKLLEKLNENNNLFTAGLIKEDTYNIYRVEEGIPDSTNEINDEFIPSELELLNEIDFTKGCYIGQEIIARLDTYDKVQKGLGGIEFVDDEIKEEDFSLVDLSNKEVGIITSIAKSIKQDKWIGLAVIRKAFNNDGQELNAVGEKNNYKVIVKKLPF
ncbi:MAG: glycine cleavage T C-terminal barrel domain-containing protein [Ignavibacteria bacterium]|jgi:folate-binding protein YgfZ